VKALEIVLPKLHPSQRAVYTNSARFRVVACGRRWGKTTLALYEILRALVAGQRAAYCTPIYKTLVEVFAQSCARVRPIMSALHRGEFRVETKTGGLLECWSLSNPDRLRGRGYDLLIVDEAAYVTRLLEAWHSALRPTLTDRQGRALFLSTPRGHNDFYALYETASCDPDWASFSYTTFDNPLIAPQEIESARRALPERDFAQEYLARFNALANLVFESWGRDNVDPALRYDPKRALYWGVDDGYVAGEGRGSASYHPRVILAVQLDARGRVCVLGEYVATHELAEVSIANALRALGRPEAAFVDASAQELKARLHALGVQTVNGTHRVEEGVAKLRRLVRDGEGQPLLLVHPSCEELIYEMSHWGYERVEGEIRYQNANDHAIDALRYVVYKLGALR